MKVFVTGATGFIGLHLIPQLVKQKHQVTALSRDTKRIAALKKYKVKIIIGDITTPSKFLEELNQNDVLIHLAGMRSNWGKATDFYKINAYFIKHFFKQPTRLKHIIITSSVYAIGDLHHIPANENHPLHPNDLYGKSKLLLEQLVKYESKKYNIHYTIIRPAIVYGPQDNNMSFMNKLIKMIKNNKFFLIGSGKNLLHLIYIDDLIHGYTQALKQGGENKIYILAAAEPITVLKIKSIISEKLGKKTSNIYLPYYPVLFTSYVSEIIFKAGFAILPNLFKGEPPLLPTKVKIIGRSWHYDITKAQKELKFKPKISYKEGIANIFFYDKIERY